MEEQTAMNEEIAKAAESLNHLAIELAKSLARFKI